MNNKLLPPFSWFGSKRAVADKIWQGLGNVTNYVEPFMGSLSILLANPNPAKIETVNDIDAGLVNFYRAIQNDPNVLIPYVDYPVTELDLHARHKYLIEHLNAEFKDKLNTDPEFYDVKLGGYWLYGQVASIPGNWLNTRGLNAMPMLSSAGSGALGLRYDMLEWFKKLQNRLKRVRILSGDWKRIVSPAITFKNKGLVEKDITGIVLDSPYSTKKRVKNIYQEDNDIYSEVCNWAIDNGNNPRLRIVLCGYDGDHTFPIDWQQVPWKTGGGMANQALGNSIGKENAKREMMYFSPHCLTLESI